jgi:hypothetical protein
MAGSNKSGQDMESGRVNRADDPTRIWAQQRSGEQFTGDTMFVVERARDFNRGFSGPSAKQHAIVGRGALGGAGVIGFDSQAAIRETADADISRVGEVGVFGMGDRAGVVGVGLRGPGVEGVGADISNGPGEAGVVGRGGRQRKGYQITMHGPGVIGIGGGHSRLLERDKHFLGNVGVLGQGAGDGSETDAHGALEVPGVGVVGRGGISRAKGFVSPGVVGIAGGAESLSSDRPPNFGLGFFTGSFGVFGAGATGVHGVGLAGPGVSGQAEGMETGVYGAGHNGIMGVGAKGRGGIFQSEESAQLQLVPLKVSGSTTQADFSPTAITDAGRLMPKTGHRGDLMAVIDENGLCSLWFCVRERQDSIVPSARWAQVLLGPVVTGRA